MATKNTI